MATRRYAGLAAIVTTTAGLLAATAGSASAAGSPAFVGPLHHTSVVASTVPGNGDVNPYGVTVIRLVVKIPAFGLPFILFNTTIGSGFPETLNSSARTLDSSGSPPGAGALFGLAVKPGADAVYYVDDATNTLNLLH
jgi:hypothetical protein